MKKITIKQYFIHSALNRSIGLISKSHCTIFPSITCKTTTPLFFAKPYNSRAPYFMWRAFQFILNSIISAAPCFVNCFSQSFSIHLPTITHNRQKNQVYSVIIEWLDFLTCQRISLVPPNYGLVVYLDVRDPYWFQPLYLYRLVPDTHKTPQGLNVQFSHCPVSLS